MLLEASLEEQVIECALIVSESLQLEIVFLYFYSHDVITLCIDVPAQHH